jgi:hypothetical protein
MYERNKGNEGTRKIDKIEAIHVVAWCTGLQAYPRVAVVLLLRLPVGAFGWKAEQHEAGWMKEGTHRVYKRSFCGALFIFFTGRSLWCWL